MVVLNTVNILLLPLSPVNKIRGLYKSLSSLSIVVSGFRINVEEVVGSVNLLRKIYSTKFTKYGLSILHGFCQFCTYSLLCLNLQDKKVNVVF